MTPRELVGYTHDQTAAAAEWLIFHQLNTTSPVVDCFITYNGEFQKAIPKNVEIIDAANIKITWTSPISGKAFIM